MTYTDIAQAGRAALDAARRKEFETGIAGVARTPYGCGSSAVNGDQDRREATLGRVAVIRYEVSPGVLIVTVLRVIPAP
ncbi:hypothetical protein ACFVIM_03940 [Streptomyces sp. NPDC057638]|uniref:hypothetical protein n=1 Tax=Streptomyces sp. NPDC057638 TaxID=3346190 RepID=UPI0036786EE0